ncbi:MAG TPA: ChbG/HpnK family deacetylase, partial [Chryseolinea sp.]|nr:ChbG/HpnK family deacetylase [Chryseolinea sp.]
VYNEIKAQLERARGMGFDPTHLDSHMGTLFGSPDYIRQYVRLGIENKIPVMIPGGHNTAIVEELKRDGNPQAEAFGKQMTALGKTLWDAGLPVLDDLHNVSYGWKYEKFKTHYDEAALRKEATANYIASIRALKPGLTMVIMHCTEPSPKFAEISSSGLTRKADLLAMTDPAFKKFITENKIILTTWRDVMKRRNKQ